MAISMAMSETDKFMDKFDPVNSNREKRKKLRTQPGKSESKKDKKTSHLLYNEKGLLLHDESDKCDCLNEKCPGCFFPCSKCRSPKCGSECRCHRRWVLETVTVDGTQMTTTNKRLPP